MTIRKNGTSPHENENKSLQWTGKIIDLIELGSALHENKAFNNGNVSQKEMFEYLAKVFQGRCWQYIPSVSGSSYAKNRLYQIPGHTCTTTAKKN